MISSAAPWGAFFFLLGLGAGMAWWTWGTWPDSQVDFGRELYVAWRLAEGDVLYRDVAWFNGPLSAYTNAFLFRVFGVGLDTLVFANLALLALLVGVAHRLLARLADELSATLACAVMLLLFSFLQLSAIANYNFVTPYSHEVTHGLALAVCAVACLARYERGGPTPWLAAAGALTGLTFLTKPEIFVASAAALAVGILFLAPGARSRPAALGGVLLSALAPVAAAFALLCLSLTPGEAASGLTAGVRGVIAGEATALPFYRQMAGLHDPGARLASILAHAAAAFAVLLPAAGLDWLLRGRRRAGAFAALAFFAVVVLGLSQLGIDWLRALRPLPLFLIAFLAFLALRRLRGATAAPSAALAALATLSLALLGKMLLGVWAAQYGFALALPGTLVLLLTLFCFIPRALERAGGSGRIFRAAALALVVLLLAAHLRSHGEWLAGNTVTVASGRDAFRDDGRGADVNGVLAFLEEAFGPEATLAVLPEGVMLNYLGRRRNPTPYVNFMPPELVLFGEDAMVAAFEAHPPDAVVLWHKDTSEYGVPLFGTHYGQALFAWLRAHYRVVATFGAPPLRRPSLYGLQVLQRNDAPPPALPDGEPR